MFCVRLVKADYYMNAPIPGLDVKYSEFRGFEVKQVPVIRIYGSTTAGQKVCLHIHGVFPYIYIPYDGCITKEKFMYQIASAIDKALNISLGNSNSLTQHVYKVTLVSAVPFYGFHLKTHQFLKIYFYNPLMIKKASDLLQGGVILGQIFQPHEAHIPFILQFCIDYNLHGMSLVRLSTVRYRQGKIEGSEIDVTSLNDIPEELKLPECVLRISTCSLEVDAVAADILNQKELSGQIARNPGIQSIWDEEKERRRNENRGSQFSISCSQQRNPSSTKSEIFHLDRLKQHLGCDTLQKNVSEPALDRSCGEKPKPYPAQTPEGENILEASVLLTHVDSLSQKNTANNSGSCNMNIKDLAVNINAEEKYLLPSTTCSKDGNESMSSQTSFLNSQCLSLAHALQDLVEEDSVLGSQIAINGKIDVEEAVDEEDMSQILYNDEGEDGCTCDSQRTTSQDEQHCDLTSSKLPFYLPQLDGANDVVRDEDDEREEESKDHKKEQQIKEIWPEKYLTDYPSQIVNDVSYFPCHLPSLSDPEFISLNKPVESSSDLCTLHETIDPRPCVSLEVNNSLNNFSSEILCENVTLEECNDENLIFSSNIFGAEEPIEVCKDKAPKCILMGDPWLNAQPTSDDEYLTVSSSSSAKDSWSTDAENNMWLTPNGKYLSEPVNINLPEDEELACQYDPGLLTDSNFEKSDFSQTNNSATAETKRRLSSLIKSRTKSKEMQGPDKISCEATNVDEVVDLEREREHTISDYETPTSFASFLQGSDYDQFLDETCHINVQTMLCNVGESSILTDSVFENDFKIMESPEKCDPNRSKDGSSFERSVLKSTDEEEFASSFSGRSTLLPNLNRQSTDQLSGSEQILERRRRGRKPKGLKELEMQEYGSVPKIVENVESNYKLRKRLQVYKTGGKKLSQTSNALLNNMKNKKEIANVISSQELEAPMDGESADSDYINVKKKLGIFVRDSLNKKGCVKMVSQQYSDCGSSVSLNSNVPSSSDASQVLKSVISTKSLEGSSTRKENRKQQTKSKSVIDSGEGTNYRCTDIQLNNMTSVSEVSLKLIEHVECSSAKENKPCSVYDEVGEIEKAKIGQYVRQQLGKLVELRSKRLLERTGNSNSVVNDTTEPANKIIHNDSVKLKRHHRSRRKVTHSSVKASDSANTISENNIISNINKPETTQVERFSLCTSSAMSNLSHASEELSSCSEHTCLSDNMETLKTSETTKTPQLQNYVSENELLNLYSIRPCFVRLHNCDVHFPLCKKEEECCNMTVDSNPHLDCQNSSISCVQNTSCVLPVENSGKQISVFKVYSQPVCEKNNKNVNVCFPKPSSSLVVPEKMHARSEGLQCAELQMKCLVPNSPKLGGKSVKKASDVGSLKAVIQAESPRVADTLDMLPENPAKIVRHYALGGGMYMDSLEMESLDGCDVIENSASVLTQIPLIAPSFNVTESVFNTGNPVLTDGFIKQNKIMSNTTDNVEHGSDIINDKFIDAANSDFLSFTRGSCRKRSIYTEDKFMRKREKLNDSNGSELSNSITSEMSSVPYQYIRFGKNSDDMGSNNSQLKFNSEIIGDEPHHMGEKVSVNIDDVQKTHIRKLSKGDVKYECDNISEESKLVSNLSRNKKNVSTSCLDKKLILKKHHLGTSISHSKHSLNRNAVNCCSKKLSEVHDNFPNKCKLQIYSLRESSLRVKKKSKKIELTNKRYKRQIQKCSKNVESPPNCVNEVSKNIASRSENTLVKFNKGKHNERNKRRNLCKEILHSKNSLRNHSVSSNSSTNNSKTKFSEKNVTEERKEDINIPCFDGANDFCDSDAIVDCIQVAAKKVKKSKRNQSRIFVPCDGVAGFSPLVNKKKGRKSKLLGPTNEKEDSITKVSGQSKTMKAFNSEKCMPTSVDVNNEKSRKSSLVDVDHEAVIKDALENPDNLDTAKDSCKQQLKTQDSVSVFTHRNIVQKGRKPSNSNYNRLSRKERINAPKLVEKVLESYSVVTEKKMSSPLPNDKKKRKVSERNDVLSHEKDICTVLDMDLKKKRRSLKSHQDDADEVNSSQLITDHKITDRAPNSCEVILQYKNSTKENEKRKPTKPAKDNTEDVCKKVINTVRRVGQRMVKQASQNKILAIACKEVPTPELAYPKITANTSKQIIETHSSLQDKEKAVKSLNTNLLNSYQEQTSFQDDELKTVKNLNGNVTEKQLVTPLPKQNSTKVYYKNHKDIIMSLENERKLAVDSIEERNPVQQNIYRRNNRGRSKSQSREIVEKDLCFSQIVLNSDASITRQKSATKDPHSFKDTEKRSNLNISGNHLIDTNKNVSSELQNFKQNNFHRRSRSHPREIERVERFYTPQINLNPSGKAIKTHPTGTGDEQTNSPKETVEKMASKTLGSNLIDSNKELTSVQPVIQYKMTRGRSKSQSREMVEERMCASQNIVNVLGKDVKAHQKVISEEKTHSQIEPCEKKASKIHRKDNRDVGKEVPSELPHNKCKNFRRRSKSQPREVVKSTPQCGLNTPENTVKTPVKVFTEGAKYPQIKTNEKLTSETLGNISNDLNEKICFVQQNIAPKNYRRSLSSETAEIVEQKLFVPQNAVNTRRKAITIHQTLTAEKELYSHIEIDKNKKLETSENKDTDTSEEVTSVEADVTHVRSRSKSQPREIHYRNRSRQKITAKETNSPMESKQEKESEIGRNFPNSSTDVTSSQKNFRKSRSRFRLVGKELSVPQIALSVDKVVKTRQEIMDEKIYSHMQTDEGNTFKSSENGLLDYSNKFTSEQPDIRRGKCRRSRSQPGKIIDNNLFSRVAMNTVDKDEEALTKTTADKRILSTKKTDEINVTKTSGNDHIEFGSDTTPVQQNNDNKYMRRRSKSQPRDLVEKEFCTLPNVVKSLEKAVKVTQNFSSMEIDRRNTSGNSESNIIHTYNKVTSKEKNSKKRSRSQPRAIVEKELCASYIAQKAANNFVKTLKINAEDTLHSPTRENTSKTSRNDHMDAGKNTITVKQIDCKYLKKRSKSQPREMVEKGFGYPQGTVKTCQKIMDEKIQSHLQTNEKNKPNSSESSHVDYNKKITSGQIEIKKTNFRRSRSQPREIIENEFCTSLTAMNTVGKDVKVLPQLIGDKKMCLSMKNDGVNSSKTSGNDSIDFGCDPTHLQQNIDCKFLRRRSKNQHREMVEKELSSSPNVIKSVEKAVKVAQKFTGKNVHSSMETDEKNNLLKSGSNIIHTNNNVISEKCNTERKISRKRSRSQPGAFIETESYRPQIAQNTADKSVKTPKITAGKKMHSCIEREEESPSITAGKDYMDNVNCRYLRRSKSQPREIIEKDFCTTSNMVRTRHNVSEEKLHIASGTDRKNTTETSEYYNIDTSYNLLSVEKNINKKNFRRRSRSQPRDIIGKALCASQIALDAFDSSVKPISKITDKKMFPPKKTDENVESKSSENDLIHSACAATSVWHNIDPKTCRRRSKSQPKAIIRKELLISQNVLPETVTTEVDTNLQMESNDKETLNSECHHSNSRKKKLTCSEKNKYFKHCSRRSRSQPREIGVRESYPSLIVQNTAEKSVKTRLKTTAEEKINSCTESYVKKASKSSGNSLSKFVDKETSGKVNEHKYFRRSKSQPRDVVEIESIPTQSAQKIFTISFTKQQKNNATKETCSPLEAGEIKESQILGNKLINSSWKVSPSLHGGEQMKTRRALRSNVENSSEPTSDQNSSRKTSEKYEESRSGKRVVDSVKFVGETCKNKLSDCITSTSNVLDDECNKAKQISKNSAEGIAGRNINQKTSRKVMKSNIDTANEKETNAEVVEKESTSLFKGVLEDFCKKVLLSKPDVEQMQGKRILRSNVDVTKEETYSPISTIHEESERACKINQEAQIDLKTISSLDSYEVGKADVSKYTQVSHKNMSCMLKDSNQLKTQGTKKNDMKESENAVEKKSRKKVELPLEGKTSPLRVGGKGADISKRNLYIPAEEESQTPQGVDVRGKGKLTKKIGNTVKSQNPMLLDSSQNLQKTMDNAEKSISKKLMNDFECSACIHQNGVNTPQEDNAKFNSEVSFTSFKGKMSIPVRKNPNKTRKASENHGVTTVEYSSSLVDNVQKGKSVICFDQRDVIKRKMRVKLEGKEKKPCISKQIKRRSGSVCKSRKLMLCCKTSLPISRQDISKYLSSKLGSCYTSLDIKRFQPCLLVERVKLHSLGYLVAEKYSGRTQRNTKSKLKTGIRKEHMLSVAGPKCQRSEG